ncbi:MAG: hypothetical protein M1312_02000 [Patescibacteria group bacterium]|nr:hypothetical protein [Patescibacteria group bacterium]
MKLRIEKGYVLVISRSLVYFFGIGTGRPSLTKAAALFPFIFVRSEDVIVQWLINHERIHFRQSLELLFIGEWIMSAIEQIYSLVILGKSLQETYFWSSAEQEAYRNQNNLHYLKERKFWNQFYYLLHKKRFLLGKTGEIVYPE